MRLMKENERNNRGSDEPGVKIPQGKGQPKPATEQEAVQLLQGGELDSLTGRRKMRQT
jgi:hypothetical protein